MASVAWMLPAIIGSGVAVAVGDVVGKGIAASLLMASVRASLRAHAENVYDLAIAIARFQDDLASDLVDGWTAGSDFRMAYDTAAAGNASV